MPNLKSGTKPMKSPALRKEQDFAAMERLLKTCSMIGVEELHIDQAGGFKAKFGPLTLRNLPTSGQERKAEMIDEETLDDQNLQVKKTQVEDMLIEDPLAYERLLLNEELIDAHG